MTIRTYTIKLVFKGQVIRSRTTTDKDPSLAIKSWKKMYPPVKFAECKVVVCEGKKYTYDSYYTPLTVKQMTANRLKIIKRRVNGKAATI